MSQVFSGDSVNLPAAASITTTAETPAAVGNFLNPPFGNCKAVLTGMAIVTSGTGTTAVTMRIRRNPNAENVVVMASSPVTATAGATAIYFMQAADSIPDGRPVQYEVTVTQTGASGNGTIINSNISAFLISG